MVSGYFRTLEFPWSFGYPVSPLHLMTHFRQPSSPHRSQTMRQLLSIAGFLTTGTRNTLAA